MEYLTKEDIILINKKTLERHGGHFIPPHNFLNEPPLDYLIEAVEGEMFGKPLYPEIYDKAGLYMFNIVSNHIFQDGNKRTGLGAALLFLALNNYQLKEELSMPKKKGFAYVAQPTLLDKKEVNDEILISFTLDLAAGEIDLVTCQAWFKANIVLI